MLWPPSTEVHDRAGRRVAGLKRVPHSPGAGRPAAWEVASPPLTLDDTQTSGPHRTLGRDGHIRQAGGHTNRGDGRPGTYTGPSKQRTKWTRAPKNNVQSGHLRTNCASRGCSDDRDRHEECCRRGRRRERRNVRGRNPRPETRHSFAGTNFSATARPTPIPITISHTFI